MGVVLLETVPLEPLDLSMPLLLCDMGDLGLTQITVVRIGS